MGMAGDCGLSFSGPSRSAIHQAQWATPNAAGIVMRGGWSRVILSLARVIGIAISIAHNLLLAQITDNGRMTMAGPAHTHHWVGCGWFTQLMSTAGGRVGRGGLHR